MSVNDDKNLGYSYSDEMASGIRTRSGLIVLLSSSAVALAFGISFYFALVSSETAIAMQFQELAPVVARLKAMLVVNTIGFVAVIIASFWVLSRLVTARMFTSLGRVMAGLRKAAENRYPEYSAQKTGGPFADFESLWDTVVSETRERERKEIEALERCLEPLSRPESAEIRVILDRMIEEKKRRILAGASNQSGDNAASGDRDDALFMQPV